MNERIEQLVQLAFFDETTSQPSDKMYTFSDHKMEKFAELIVKECLDILDDEDTGDIYGKSVRIAAIRITTHFGVEE